MYEPHPEIVTPADETAIWRYIDLESVIALLSSRQLHFTRLSDLKDPWEGVWPKAVVEAIKGLTPKVVADGFMQALPLNRATCYVSCWHASDCESAALWDQYSRSAGFALRSTVGSLKKALESAPRLFIGQVEYIDYDGASGQMGTLLRYAFNKRKSFAHEKEVRAMIWHLPTRKNADGEEIIDPSLAGSVIYADIDLTELIHAAYVSPTSPKWLFPHIEKLFSAFELAGKPIIRSELYDRHVY